MATYTFSGDARVHLGLSEMIDAIIMESETPAALPALIADARSNYDAEQFADELFNEMRLDDVPGFIDTIVTLANNLSDLLQDGRP